MSISANSGAHDSPPTEAQQVLAAAVAGVLRNSRFHRGRMTIEQAVEAAIEMESPQSPARDKREVDGTFNWSRLYSPNPQMGPHHNLSLDLAVDRVTPDSWRDLERGARALAPIDVQDAVALATGDPSRGDLVEYRGSLVIDAKDIDASYSSLEELVVNGSGQSDKKKIAGLLMIGDGGKINAAGNLEHRTLTGIPELDQVLLDVLAPFAHPESTLEGRCGETQWHYEFTNGRAIRREGRDPHVEMFEKIAEDAVAGLAIDSPEVFLRGLRTALTGMASSQFGADPDAAAVAANRKILLAFLTTDHGTQSDEAVKRFHLDAIRASAKTHERGTEFRVSPAAMLKAQAPPKTVAQAQSGLQHAMG